MARSSRLAPLLALCLLAAVGLLLGPVGGADVDDRSPGGAFEQVEEEIDADSVVMSATVDENGDASWEIEYRLELADETDEQAFEDLQADIAANESAYLDPFEQRIRRTADTAENATGRAMTVDGFEITTSRRDQPQGSFGMVTYSFAWDGFAAVDDELVVGDALDRLFLDDGERLEFRWPEGYRVADSSPSPGTVEDRRVVWRGPIDFDAGQPRVVLVPEEGTAAGSRWLVAGAILVGVVLALAGYWRFWKAPEESRDASRTPPPEAGGSGPPPAATEDGQDESGSDAPPLELLSNEEKVLRLLNENGGRLKQKAVADELGWSAAKTSQVVGDLREEDRIESFRLGRENVLTLPDVDLEGDSSARASTEDES